MSAIGSLAGVTIVVPDLDAAIAAYRDGLGYVAGQLSLVQPALADQWGAPNSTGARVAMLYPESGGARFIRLVEGQSAAISRPLATLGWIAAEIIVQDVEGLARRLGVADSPFTIIGPPAVLDLGFTDQIKAMQVVGPGGETLYLTEVGGPIPGFRLPVAQSFVGSLFIMVLGALDIDDAAIAYTSEAHPLGDPFDVRVPVLSTALGLSPAHRHRLATVALDEATLLEIDEFPPDTAARGMSRIGLPSAIAIVSFVGAAPRVRATGSVGEWYDIVTAPQLYRNKKKL